MQPNRPFQLTLLYAGPFVLVVTALFLFLLFLERRTLAEEQEEQLTHTASAILEQVIVTRLWNAGHGGVYAAVDSRTPPNPYLDDRDRDIITRSGKRYTKLNPAYMTRQIAELARSRDGYRFNITSLRPLNPSNRPDPWEEEALRSFEQGTMVRRAAVRQEGRPVFRYMVPLTTDEACLACHAKQGYRPGEIRGGISVSVPMDESDRIYRARARTYLVVGTGLWLIIIVFIMLTAYILSRKVVREMAAEVERSRLRTAIEMAGAVAHEIRQPLTVLVTYFDLLKHKFAGDPELVKELGMMSMQCRRIDAMIEKMLNITEYRSRAYVGDIRITDLGTGPADDAPPET